MRKTTLALAIAATLGVASQAQASDLWDIYQLAVNNDPTYLQAQATYDAAAEDKPIAWAGYLPSITLNGSRQVQHSSGQIPLFFDPTTNTYVNGNGTFDNYNTQYTAQLTQQIFNWSVWQGIEQADANVAQAQATFVAAQQSLILRTATTYFNVLNSRDTLAADHAATVANAKQLEQAKEKYDVGMSAITDVENAQAAYDQSVTNNEESLRAVTGQPVGELLEPSPDMPLNLPQPNNSQQWVDTALKQNPNLMAAQAGVDAADANVGIKRAGHYPVLNLTLSHNKTNSDQIAGLPPASLGLPPGPNLNVGQINDLSGNTAMLQLSVPIFSGGGVMAQVSQAEHLYDAAVDNVKLVNRQTEQQARTAYLGVLTGISQVQALKQSVKSNQTSMDATETGMQVGTRTIVDVLTARQNLLTAQTSFANARYTYLESVLQLKQAAGNLNETDLKQINVMLQVKAPTEDLAIPQPSDETSPAPTAGTGMAPAAATSAPTAAPSQSTATPPTSTPPRG
jgi:outer membrane protein